MPGNLCSNDFVVRPPSTVRATAIAAGADFTCEIRMDRSLWCWGNGSNGQTVLTPWRVGSDGDWIAISAGADHTCGIRAGGALCCWGSNQDHQLGDGTIVLKGSTPVAIGAGTTWSAVGAGAKSTCAISAEGALFCWGELWRFVAEAL